MRTALLLVVALLSSGCISALASDLPDPTSQQVPAGPGAGSAATHGVPQRSESPVTVTVGPDGFVAAQDVTVRNDFGGAASARVKLATQNGAVTASAWGEGGYRLAAHLEGRGKSEDDARAALATLTVLSQDGLAGGPLGIGLQVRFGDPPAPAPSPIPVPIPIGTGPGLQRSASIVASLPPGPAMDLAAGTTNGAVRVEGLHGPRLDLDSTNGALSVGGAWDAARLDTTNGAIRLDALVNDLEADTTNGAIGGTLESQRSCRQSLQTTNGAIDVALRVARQGYGLEGSATNGRVTIDVAGAHAEGKRTQHAQTPGFGSAAVQVTLTAESTNGNVKLSSL